MQHLLFILVHVDWVRTGGFGLWVGVNLACQSVASIVRVIGVSALSYVEQLLVLFNALLRGPSNELGDSAPHGGEDFTQMEQHFLFVSGPFSLLD